MANPLWHSCLKNPMDRGAFWVTVHKVEKSQTQLSAENKIFKLPSFDTCIRYFHKEESHF